MPLVERFDDSPKELQKRDFDRRLTFNEAAKAVTPTSLAK
jgi:hypothetical protein